MAIAYGACFGETPTCGRHGAASSECPEDALEQAATVAPDRCPGCDEEIVVIADVSKNRIPPAFGFHGSGEDSLTR